MMLKPDSLRRALTDAVTVLKTNPDMLRIFVDTHQRPEAAKAEGKTETQKERKTPARTGAPESETGHAEESAKSTGSARR